MINADDFSTEATRSGINMARALTNSGYSNILSAEVFTRGFYEADELMENFKEFPETEKILMSNEYQDIGVASVLGEIHGCPIQVIIVHLGGYVPPNYTQQEISSWEALVGNIENVMPSWRSLQTADGIDQNKLNRLLSILDTRLQNGRKIVAKMRANQWLSDEEKAMTENDKNLAIEANRLISELNTR